MLKTYTHLDVQERTLIETQLTQGMSAAAIAAGLMRARSTVTREMFRNGWKLQGVHRGRPTIAGNYRAVQASRRAQALAVKPCVLRKLIQATNFGSKWLIISVRA